MELVVRRFGDRIKAEKERKMKKHITCIAFLVIFMLSFSFFACAQKPTNYVFVCPDGAPAIATYAVMDSKNIDFIVYDNSQAVSSISADMASNKADFALLPINQNSHKNN